MKRNRTALALCGILVLSMAGCGVAAADGTAQDEENEESVVREAVQDEEQRSPGGEGERPGPGANEEPGVMGKIESVSEDEIVVYLAQIGRPDGNGSRGERENGPGDGGEPPETEGDPPEEPSGEGRGPRGGGRAGGGNGPGGGMNYSGEATAYALSDAVTVTRGMGDSAQTLELSDLSGDDMVRLELDDDDVVVSIQVMDNAGERGDAPPEDLPEE